MAEALPPAETRLRDRLSHPASFFGALLFVVGFGASVVALLADIFGGDRRPYQGILTFVLYPGVMMFGLALLFIGRAISRRRGPPKRRSALLLWSMAFFVVAFVAMSVVGAFHAWEFTESDEFCGTLCHTPMEPQHVAHLASPHARIGCTECHVAPGVGGYVDAKISGIHQLVQVTTGGYPHPIRAPRESVPAGREACEECHEAPSWRGERIENQARYGYDARSSRRYLRLLLEIGGTRGDVTSGIHWHAAESTKVTYRSSEPGGEIIPWVEVEDEDGTKVVYRDKTSDLSESALAALGTHVMDCRDCHNRIGHSFPPIDLAVDAAIESGDLDATLPSIKRTVVGVLRPEMSADAAQTEWLTSYRERFPDVVRDRGETVERASRAIGQLAARSLFPAMKVDGSTYPDHSGHRTSPGCFRCHAGNHVAEDGRSIPSDCDSCHRFLEADRGGGGLASIPADAASLHPFQQETHAQVMCWTCHSTTSNPHSACLECHKDHKGPHGKHFDCSTCHRPHDGVEAASGCQRCHPAGSSPMHVVPEHGDCTSCHDPHTLQSSDERCAPCHASVENAPLAEHHPGEACHPCHDFSGMDRHLLGH